MRTRTSPWVAQTLGTGLLAITAINAIRPMVSYRAIELGASPAIVGVVAAGYASLAIVVSVPIGRRVDRLGERRSIVAGVLLMLAVSAALIVIRSVVGLFLAQALLGASQGLTFLGIQSLVATGDPAGRDGRFGIFTATTSVGQMVGPAAAGLLVGTQGTDVTPAFVMTTGLTLGAVLTSLLLWRWPPPARRHPTVIEPLLPSVRRVLRSPGMVTALVTSMCLLACIDLVIVYLPSFGEEHGIPVATIGLLLGARAASSTLVRLVLNPSLRLLGRRRLLTSSMGALAVSLALLPAASGVIWLLYLLMVAAGATAGMAQPIIMAWVAGGAPTGSSATALGVRLTGDRVAQLFLPLAVGGIAGAAGVGAIFLTLCALAGSGAVLVARSRAATPP